MIQYNYCPKCGAQIEEDSDPAYCSVCNVSYFQNPKPGAGVLPVKDGKVLLARRSREPFKGSYGIIGGFIEIGELPEETAIREAKEETGLDIKITSLLGIYNGRYGNDGNHTLNIHYISEVIGGEMQAKDDVYDLEWIPISEVPLDEGLQDARAALRDLKQLFAENLPS